MELFEEMIAEKFKEYVSDYDMSDVNSIDHGDLGVSLLFDNGEIDNFYKDENDFNKIKLAIKYHNKISVLEDIVGDERVMCNIARDADKLDIFHLLIENKSLFMEDDTTISKDVRECFFENKMINYKDIKSKNEKIVLSLAMFYDINFKYSYKHIVDTKILDDLYEHVNNKERFKEYFEHLKKVVNERCSSL